MAAPTPPPPSFFCTPQPFQHVIALLIALAGAVTALREMDPELFGDEGYMGNSQVGQTCQAASGVQLGANGLAAFTAGGVGAWDALLATDTGTVMEEDPVTGEYQPSTMMRGIAPSVLPYAIGVVDGLSLMTGTGAPYEAHDIRVNSYSRKTVSGLTEKALPGKDWQGRASQTYAQRNQALPSISNKLYDNDQDLVRYIKAQAGLVAVTRMVLATVILLLSRAYFWEMYMKTAITLSGGMMRYKINGEWIPQEAVAAIEANEDAIFCATVGVGIAATMIGVAAAFQGYFGSAAKITRQQYQKSPAWSSGATCVPDVSASTVARQAAEPAVGGPGAFAASMSGNPMTPKSAEPPTGNVATARMPAGAPRTQWSRRDASPSGSPHRQVGGVNQVAEQRLGTASSWPQQDQAETAAPDAAARSETVPTYAYTTSKAGPAPITLSQ